MAGWCEASEIVSSLVNTLQEWCLSVDVAAINEHSTDFLDHLRRLQYMFQHGLNPDAIEGSIGKRQMMAICDQVGEFAPIDVGSDDADLLMFIERCCPESDDPSTDDKDHGPVRASFDLLDELSRIVLGWPGRCRKAARHFPEEGLVPPLCRRRTRPHDPITVENRSFEIDQNRRTVDNREAGARVASQSAVEQRRSRPPGSCLDSASVPRQRGHLTMARRAGFNRPHTRTSSRYAGKNDVAERHQVGDRRASGGRRTFLCLTRPSTCRTGTSELRIRA